MFVLAMKWFVVIQFLIDLVALQRLGSRNVTWTSARIRFELSKHEIFPHVVKKVANNIQLLEVAYGLHKMDIDFGGKHTVRQIAEKPTRVKWNAVEDSYYALLLVGPDCPTYKDHNFRSYRHWVVVNILGDKIDTGEELTPYEGLVDTYGPGVHRLVFLIYRQPGIEKIDFSQNRMRNSSRTKFKVKPFTWTHRFYDPIAINYFYCKNLT